MKTFIRNNRYKMAKPLNAYHNVPDGANIYDKNNKLIGLFFDEKRDFGKTKLVAFGIFKLG